MKNEATVNRNDLNRALCAVLETLDETVTGAAPESILYLALEIAGLRAAWEPARNILASALLVRFSPNHEASITPAGRAIAAKSRAALEGGRR